MSQFPDQQGVIPNLYLAEFAIKSPVKQHVEERLRVFHRYSSGHRHKPEPFSNCQDHPPTPLASLSYFSFHLWDLLTIIAKSLTLHGPGGVTAQ